jgi:hypothetical protein
MVPDFMARLRPDRLNSFVQPDHYEDKDECKQDNRPVVDLEFKKKLYNILLISECLKNEGSRAL